MKRRCANVAWPTAGASGIKILGDGELTKKLTVSAHAFSASATGQDRSQRRNLRSRWQPESRRQPAKA